MNKTIFSLLLPLAIILTSCEELDYPAEFTASQGTYIGAIHLAYSDVEADDWIQYVLYRFDENSANWIEITWTEVTQWDYTGYDLGNGVIPGKEYRFKMQAHTNKTSFSEFSGEVTGYAFDPEPCVITSIVSEGEGDYITNSIYWENPNDLLDIQNLVDIEYHIYRAEETAPDDFEKVYTHIESVLHGSGTSGIAYNYSAEDDYVDADIPYIYKVNTAYRYLVVDNYGNHNESNLLEVDGSSSEPSGGNQGNDPITYTTTDLGQVISAGTNNTIFDPKDKMVDGTLYLCAIDGNPVTGGTPLLYTFNGSAWEEVWTCSELNETQYTRYGVASNGDSYVLGSNGAGTVYKWDGANWTDLGLPAGLNGYYGLEVFEDEVYVLVEFGDVLQVYKYNGSDWAQAGADIASGTGSLYNLESLNGSLYVTYAIGDVLYIRHMNGSSWDTNLQWEQEWLADIELAHTGSELFFSSGSASAGFDGGVYRVTSGTTVENLIPEGHETWFTLGAFDLTADSDGNLVVASMKWEYTDASQTELINYPHLNLYNGSEWKTVSGDFTDGILPVTVSASGTDIIYVFGDKSTETELHDATVLKAKKLSK